MGLYGLVTGGGRGGGRGEEWGRERIDNKFVRVSILQCDNIRLINIFLYENFSKDLFYS